MTVVVDDGGTEEVAEVAEVIGDVAETVAEAVADAVADAVEDSAGGGQTVGEEIDRWVGLESRLGNIESRLNDALMRPSVSYEDVERIAREVAVPVAAEVAEEVAEVVADETASGDDGAPVDEITIVAPDVPAEDRRGSRWHPREWF